MKIYHCLFRASKQSKKDIYFTKNNSIRIPFFSFLGLLYSKCLKSKVVLFTKHSLRSYATRVNLGECIEK